MSALPAVVLLQAAPQGPGLLDFLTLVVPIALIFYFFLIRPQARRQREHESLLKSVGKGDSVVTTGGLHGRVVGTTEDVLTLEIAVLRGDRVRVKVDRGRIDRRVEAAGAAKDKDKDKDKDKTKEKREGA